MIDAGTWETIRQLLSRGIVRIEENPRPADDAPRFWGVKVSKQRVAVGTDQLEAIRNARLVGRDLRDFCG